MNLKNREQSIINDFDFFENWDQKYEYIIGLGNDLPETHTDLRCAKNLIKGCQSQVWLTSCLKNGKVFFEADSDALITKGLIALLLKVFSDSTPKQIILFDLILIESIGLNKHLSMNRSNGLGKMLENIKKISLTYLK